MGRVGIDDDLAGAAGGLQRVLHGLDLGHGNAAIGAAIESQHRHLELRHHIERVQRGHLALRPLQRTVPGDTRLDLGVVGAIEPDLPPAPAEAGDAELRGIGLARGPRPGDGGVEIGSHLRLRHLGHDLHDIVHIGHLGDIALAGIEGRGDGEIAGLGQAPADVLDMLMDAEDLLHHEDRGEGAALGGHGAVARDLAVGDRDLHLAHGQALAVGHDGGGRDRLGGQREAGRQACDDEAAARERCRRQEARQMAVSFVHSSLHCLAQPMR